MKRVIYTTITGGYDRLRTMGPFPGWDCICFSDGKSLGVRAALGMSGWQVRPFEGMTEAGILASRKPKILPHTLLTDYDYSVYIDGNAILSQEPTALCEGLGWPAFAVSEHPFRAHLLAEFDECARLGMVDATILAAQKQAYMNEGLPANTALMENNLILRRHNDAAVMELDKAWWDDMQRFPHRDQLSFPYAVWKTGFELTVMSQQTKRQYFSTKAHYRSLWTRLRRSFNKKKKHFFSSSNEH